MAHVNFNLRKINSKTPELIYLVFRWNSNKFVYSLGLKVLPKHWDAEKQRVKGIIAATDKDHINKLLNDLEKEVISFYTRTTADRQPVTKAALKENLDVFTNKINKEKNLFAFIENFIATAHQRTSPATGKLITKSTVDKYRNTFRLLKDFSKVYRRRIDFDTIDLDFYEDFSGYLTNICKMSVNTIGKNISFLKTFLNEATVKGINTKTDFRSKRFKVISEESTAVYSSESELSKIYEQDLSDNQRLERVRDLFILGAFTGLRFSDFTNIKPENIKGDNIELFQQKTGGKVIIPIHWTVKAILKKYNGATPKSISNQKLNDYIKEVYKLAGVTERVEIRTTKAGMRVIENFEKWELISTHTARRSFATNLYLKGVPSQTIMKITGHTTESAFLKYIKLDTSEHAQLVRSMWEANQPLKAVK